MSDMPRHEGPRGCGAYEVAPTLDLLNRVFFPQEAGMGHFGPHLACEENREQMRIITVEGQVVAHTGLYVSEVVTPRGELRLGGIWGVSCHPDFRRHGFGEACVRDAMRVMQEQGCDLGWLGTGITDWYRRFGWENAGREYAFGLDRGNVGLLPALEGLEVAQGLWPRLEEMLALRAASGLGCRRTPEVLRAMAGARRLECFTAAREGELVAYALLQGSWVAEYGGAAEIVAGLLGEACRRRDDRGRPTSTTNRPGDLEVFTPVHDGLAALLQGLRLPYRYHDLGMLWVANPAGLLEKLGLAGEISVAQREAGITLRRGGEEVTLSEQQLTKLLLGPEKVGDFGADLFPLEFYHWALDKV